MLKIAITGNIGTGKSEVEKLLAQKGYKVMDTDVVAHNILETDEFLKSEFKDFDVFEDGKISREKLGKLVFDDENLKTKLENIVHPKVKIEIEKFFKNNANEDYVFVAVPLLFECGMDKIFDKTVCVCANSSVCLERLVKRNNWTKDYALKRMSSQLPQELKIQKSDYIIENNGTLKDLADKVDTVF